MWSINYPGELSSNSLSFKYKVISDREKRILHISRNIRKIWHKTGIDNPIQDFLNEYNENTWYSYKTLEDLDDITLEWLNNMFTDSIHQLCEKIKQDSQNALKQ